MVDVATEIEHMGKFRRSGMIVYLNGQYIPRERAAIDVDDRGFLFANGVTLYVRLAGDTDPNSAAMVVSRYNYAFYVEQDFVYFLDLTFRHYGQG